MAPSAPELRLFHRLLDSWRGVGDVVTGMKRQGYEVSLGDHGSGQWLATFYEGHGGYEALNAAGTAQELTPWGADGKFRLATLGVPPVHQPLTTDCLPNRPTPNRPTMVAVVAGVLREFLLA